MATTPQDTGSLIELGTPLTRNHWFDGKFLRADDLARDQDYHRSALRLANQAGGFGVVHGLEVTLNGAELRLQPGLGITADGELLMLSSELAVGVDALIAATTAAAASPAASLSTAAGRARFGPCEPVAAAEAAAPVATGWRIYRITLGPHRALCGHEDVVGALCERACVTERQRPYQLEGVRLRARAEALAVPELRGIEPGGRHVRSRVASALFAREDAQTGPLPDNGGRLLSPLWCSGSAFGNGAELTLGYLVRGAGTADFVDLWSGRRERLASQAQGYWQRRTRQRPFADFIAQVAQFQCQLTGLFRDGAPPPEEGGDCEALRVLVRDLQAQLQAALDDDEEDPKPEALGVRPRAAAIGKTELDWNKAASAPVMRKIGQFVLQAAPLLKGRPDRVLLERGIVELPPAGFLPVVPGAGEVLGQVQRLVGPGVKLQLCSAPLDAIGHLFEEAQHSARTSLTRGLLDAADKPLLQIIVPDGEVQAAAPPPPPPPGYAVSLHADPAAMALVLAQVMGASLGRLAASPAAAAGVAEAAPAALAEGAAGPAAAAVEAATTRLTELMSRRLGAGAATLVSRAAALGSASALKPPAAAAAAAAATDVIADGAGRALLKAGEPPGFALAARGLPPQGDTSGKEIEAVWLEAHADGDPFDAAPGNAVGLDLQLAEEDRPDEELPAGARLGLPMSLKATLVLDKDPAKAERLRAEVERATGLVGGELRLAALREGQLRATVHTRGMPDTPDGPGKTISADFSAETVVLQRVPVTDGTHWVMALPLGNQGVVMLDCLPQGAGTTKLQMRLLTLGNATLPPLTHVPTTPPAGSAGSTTVAPLATMRTDAQALAPGAAPRKAAEAALARLDDLLGSAAPSAAAKLRLLGAATPAPAPAQTGLRALHDWVLFRRPVDARCTLAAPPPAPEPPAPQPPAPPAVVTTRYQASVLRLVPSFSGDALKTTLDALATGKLPTDKAATFALAGPVHYEDLSTQPLQAQAQLAAAFAQAGFGERVQVAVVQGAPAVDAALEERRVLILSRSLGGGTTPPTVTRLAALPPEMQALDGAFVYIVDPAVQAPPQPVPVPVPVPVPTPVPVPVVNHRQRVLLLRNEARAVLTQLGGASEFASKAADMLKRLELLSVGYFELGFALSGTSVDIVDAAGSDFNGLTAAVQARSGLGTNQLPVLLRATDDTSDKRSNASRAASALFDKLSGPGAQTQVIACNPTPAQIQSAHDALTLLFTKT